METFQNENNEKQIIIQGSHSYNENYFLICKKLTELFLMNHWNYDFVNIILA